MPKEIIIEVFEFNELSKETQTKTLERYRNEFNETEDWDWITKDFAEQLQSLNYPIDVRWSLSYCQGDGVAFYGEISHDDFDKITERLLTDKPDMIEKYKRYRPYLDNISIDGGRARYHHQNSMSLEIEYSVSGTTNLSNEINALLGNKKQAIDNQEFDLVPGLNQQIEDLEILLELFNYYYTSTNDKFKIFIKELERIVISDIKKVSGELERQGYEMIEGAQTDEALTENIIANNYLFYENGKEVEHFMYDLYERNRGG